jgi:hypothetical protein
VFLDLFLSHASEVLLRVSKRCAPTIRDSILPCSTIYTDYYFVYNPLRHMGYNHARINDSEKIYMSGDVHT